MSLGYPDTRSDSQNNMFNNPGCLTAAGIALLVAVILFSMFVFPLYNVWRSELQGKAELVRAEQNRQIKIEEAKANLEAEKLNAEAEVVEFSDSYREDRIRQPPQARSSLQFPNQSPWTSYSAAYTLADGRLWAISYRPLGERR